ncbi:tetratricopeptide repeat protein [Candidatus Viridilinea mediisalina]|uniref:Tetratricopeptide repeat protein n=1 Tax=Candidatus Viridilinea mediisalina TaxID=2024553 RepID=A0A2A6RKG6_9CHLR|nr:tetratricopeptide repeat protein [Candidatus Viridilinea mediisalina]PDW03604.1 hypothetical protein CJ255_08010 [Candidatus Viridilinea mediisalina]
MNVRISIILTISLALVFFITEGYIELRRNVAWVVLINTWISSEAKLSPDVSDFNHLDDWNFQRLAGMSAYLTGNCNEAAQAFDTALQMKPHETMMLFFAGHAYYQCGYSSIAVNRWQRAGAAPELLARCQTAFSRDEMDHARNWCQLAVATNPKLSEAHFQLGRVYQIQRDYYNALASFERAAALDQYYKMVFFQIGLTQRALGDLQSAKFYLRREIEINPTYSGSWYVIGLTYFDQQQYPEAIEYFLTSIHMDDRRYAMAETYVLNAIKDNPTNAGAYYTLGKLYLVQQRYEEAYQHLLEAERLDPERFAFNESE